MSGPRRWKDKESDALCPGCALLLARYSTLSSCHVPLPLTGGERRGCVSGRVSHCVDCYDSNVRRRRRAAATRRRRDRRSRPRPLVGVTRSRSVPDGTSVPRVPQRYARARRERGSRLRLEYRLEYLEYVPTATHRRARGAGAARRRPAPAGPPGPAPIRCEKD